jgi:hypothetical protein
MMVNIPKKMTKIYFFPWLGLRKCVVYNYYQKIINNLIKNHNIIVMFLMEFTKVKARGSSLLCLPQKYIFISPEDLASSLVIYMLHAFLCARLPSID